MKRLNKQATRVFISLLEKLGNRPFIRLESTGFMPLTMEVINKFITTEAGEATLYSVCHYHEENGVSMRDPEMCFLTVDCREQPQDLTKILIIPQRFRQDSRGIDEEGINIENNIIISYWPGYQHDHCHFANQWLVNIQQQGFLQ